MACPIPACRESGLNGDHVPCLAKDRGMSVADRFSIPIIREGEGLVNVNLINI